MKEMIIKKLGDKIGDLAIENAKLQSDLEKTAGELEEFYLMYDILAAHLKREGETVMCLIDGNAAKLIANFFKIGDETE